jgi:hypothetical protein
MYVLAVFGHIKRGRLLHAPAVSRLDVEPPVAPDFEARQLAFFQQTIKSGAIAWCLWAINFNSLPKIGAAPTRLFYSLLSLITPCYVRQRCLESCLDMALHRLPTDRAGDWLRTSFELFAWRGYRAGRGTDNLIMASFMAGAHALMAAGLPYLRPGFSVAILPACTAGPRGRVVRRSR